AWAPGPAASDEQAGGSRDVSSTAAAIEASREEERKLAAAKSDQEKAAIRRDSDIYRVTLVFKGEEAKIVKAALGEKQADALLALCREKMGGA
ncbi:MAG TPA: hypothetical protein VNI57_07220, partial [Candidatus Saccharimonadales bacterium]|nr:hypothetical protein [Candidatus Saccharimonadales bacterium]